MEIAIVTGASSGLGEKYAKLLDGEGLDELWLIARRRPQLEALAEKLQTPCRILPLDLTANASFTALQDTLTKQGKGLTVRYLLHAAGFGKMGPVTSIPPGILENMVDLNDRSAITLTQLLLPYCVPGSHLAFIASCAAFLPIPELAVYAASKAFLLRYCRALAAELAPQGILVSAVCPYWVKDHIGSKIQNSSRLPVRRTKSISSAITCWPAPRKALPAALLRASKKAAP